MPLPQMFVKFNEGFYDELGNLIRQPAKVAKHYMFTPSGLAFDLIVNLPIEIDCLWVPVEDRLNTLCVLRLLHALRVVRLFRYFRCAPLHFVISAFNYPRNYRDQCIIPNCHVCNNYVWLCCIMSICHPSYCIATYDCID